MIILFENGRAGNQLFQYIGLKKYFPKEKLIFFGCKSLSDFFDHVDVYFLNKNKFNRFFLFSLPRLIINFLADLRVIGSIEEVDRFDKFNLIVKKGLITRFFVAKEIYFQHKDVIKKIHKLPPIKKSYHKKALKWFENRKINFKLNTLIFVHVRRGDYLYWPSKDHPAFLNYEWYKKSILLIKKKLKVKPIFIIMGDDINYIKRNFKESKSLYISNNCPEVDLTIMSFCSSGILSASSFSWWGAFYSRFNKKNKGIFIAPKFWAGYRLKKWFPSKFKVEWITYLN